MVMPGRPRDASMDQAALRLIRKGVNTSPAGWLIFRGPDSYEGRLTFQRAVYYIGANPTNPNGSLGYSIQVQWRSPEGTWSKLYTPRGKDGIEGTPVGRIRIMSKSQGRREIRRQIQTGTAVYDTLTG